MTMTQEYRSEDYEEEEEDFPEDHIAGCEQCYEPAGPGGLARIETHRNFYGIEIISEMICPRCYFGRPLEPGDEWPPDNEGDYEEEPDF